MMPGTSVMPSTEIFLNSVKDVIKILGYSVEKDPLSKRNWMYGPADIW